jgi:hypothetical protein
LLLAVAKGLDDGDPGRAARLVDDAYAHAARPAEGMEGALIVVRVAERLARFDLDRAASLARTIREPSVRLTFLMMTGTLTPAELEEGERDARRLPAIQQAMLLVVIAKGLLGEEMSLDELL